MELEIEREPLELEEIMEGFILAPPDQAFQVHISCRRERSNWQHVATNGRLCKQQQWRWYGRFEASNLRPDGARQWRRP